MDQAIDLKAILPEVDIDLPRYLLKDAVSELNGGTDDPLARTGVNLSELLRSRHGASSGWSLSRPRKRIAPL